MDSLKRAELYHYREFDAYECLGCGEMLEVPHVAVLKSGSAAVNVRDNPENRAI